MSAPGDPDVGRVTVTGNAVDPLGNLLPSPFLSFPPSYPPSLRLSLPPPSLCAALQPRHHPVKNHLFAIRRQARHVEEELGYLGAEAGGGGGRGRGGGGGRRGGRGGGREGDREGGREEG